MHQNNSLNNFGAAKEVLGGMSQGDFIQSGTVAGLILMQTTAMTALVKNSGFTKGILMA